MNHHGIQWDLTGFNHRMWGKMILIWAMISGSKNGYGWFSPLLPTLHFEPQLYVGLSESGQYTSNMQVLERTVLLYSILGEIFSKSRETCATQTCNVDGSEQHQGVMNGVAPGAPNGFLQWSPIATRAIQVYKSCKIGAFPIRKPLHDGKGRKVVAMIMLYTHNFINNFKSHLQPLIDAIFFYCYRSPKTLMVTRHRFGSCSTLPQCGDASKLCTSGEF